MGYGNLAYKDDYYINDYIEQPKKRPAPKKKKNYRLKYIRYITAIITMSLSAGYMISTFVAVNETRADIAALEKKLVEQEAITSQKAFDLDNSIDLATIEEEATTRLGMQTPEKYQTVNVNVDREDVTEKTVGEVENASGVIGGWIKNIFGHIVEFFSIK